MNQKHLEVDLMMVYHLIKKKLEYVSLYKHSIVGPKPLANLSSNVTIPVVLFIMLYNIYCTVVLTFCHEDEFPKCEHCFSVRTFLLSISYIRGG